VNVRFSEGAIRCRVTPSELEQLLSCGSQKLAVALPHNHSLQITLRSASFGTWQLDSDPTGLWIGIPRTELQGLVQSQPSRTGIAHAFEVEGGAQLQVLLEVDVRKRPRPPATSAESAIS
jgi:hypothetical protein